MAGASKSAAVSDAVPRHEASDPARSTSPNAEHDIDWRRAVQNVVWIPHPHREPVVPAAAARRSLRCTEASFEQLVDLGLPFTDGPGGRLFDAVDLKNVGLYSRSGVTEVELAMRLMLSFMKAPREELLKPRRWRYRLQLLSSAEPGARLMKKVYRPLPERFGGRVESAVLDGGREVEVVGPLFRMPQGSEVTGSLVTHGAEHVVRSPAIRRVVDDFLDSGIRWHALPPTFAADAQAPTAMGVGNCATLCAVLQQRLHEAGFQARSYHGWMTAVAEVDHGWVEVLDDDGGTKFLDPSFTLLATRNGFGSEESRELMTGSTLNRVIPTGAPLEESYVVDDEPSDDSVVFVGRPAEQSGSTRRGGSLPWRRGSG